MSVDWGTARYYLRLEYRLFVLHEVQELSLLLNVVEPLFLPSHFVLIVLLTCPRVGFVVDLWCEGEGRLNFL